MKYKYKIGDKVKIISPSQFQSAGLIKEFIGKTMIVTERDKSEIVGNQYALSNQKGEGVAWIEESQLIKVK